MWFVYLILAVLVLIIIYSISMLFKTKNQNVAIDTDPAFVTEKALKEYLYKFTLRFSNIKRATYRSYEVGNDYYKDFKKNGEMFAPLLDMGAKFVFVSGAAPNHNKTIPVEIYALTPKMIIHKTDHYSLSDKEKDKVVSQKACFAAIYTHKFETFSHSTKNASVGGRAVAGAVLGGATGAVIGAASAANVNAKGGKVVTTGSQMNCSIRFMDSALDCILISKEIIEKYGAPENVKIKPDATKDYYLYIGHYVDSIQAYDSYKSLTDYVFGLIEQMKKEAEDN